MGSGADAPPERRCRVCPVPGDRLAVAGRQRVAAVAPRRRIGRSLGPGLGRSGGLRVDDGSTAGRRLRHAS